MLNFNLMSMLFFLNDSSQYTDCFLCELVKWYTRFANISYGKASSSEIVAIHLPQLYSSLIPQSPGLTIISYDL